MGTRRQARIAAFQTLFEVDTTGHPVGEVMERLLEEVSLPLESAQFGRRLVNGALENRDKIDRIIADAAPAWPLDQMARVDKNILRLAIFEILFNNNTVPPKAAINEAVELAKLFGGESSSKFVNGVLGTVVSRRV
ncbi:MAG: transcription antitermination factor NusB [Chloroflexi bacterium]|nr:transcription antitermination factor NusB [Chloroflexota bacterium]